jgi:predicted permease
MICVPPSLEATNDSRVLIFTDFFIAVSTLLFGLVPAWTAFVSDPAVALREGASAGQPRSRLTFGNGLVIAQVALSLVLLTLSGLFVGHLSALRGASSLGFDRTSVLIVRVALGAGDDRNAALQRYKELLARFESIPGVRSATASGVTPMSGAAGARFATVEGFQEAPEARRRLWLNPVARRYFETLRTPLISGRDFALSDEGRRVAIVNEAAARYYFAGRDALGKHVQFDGDAQAYEIIGVVADAKYNDVRTPAPRTIYLHYFPQWDFSLRTIGSAPAVGADVRRLVTEVLGNARVTKMTTLEEQVDAAIVPERLIATLSSFFGGVGALLGALGLYGLLAYAVARRTREIGLRMAIGAQAHQVMFIVMSRACALVGAGLVVGIPLAVWTTRAAAAVVGNVAAAGLVPVVIAGIVTIVVAMVASAIPARRAISVDPVVALRSE